MKVKISSILNGVTTVKQTETVGATIYDQEQAIYLAVLDLPDVGIEPGAQFKLEALPYDSRSNQNDGYFVILDFRWDDAITEEAYPSDPEIENVIGAHDYKVTSDVLATSLGMNLANGQSADFGATPVYIESTNRVWLTGTEASLVKQGEHTVLKVAQGGTLTVNTMDRDDHRLALESISLMHNGTDEAFSNGSCVNPGQHHWKYVEPTAFHKIATGPQQVVFTALRPTTIYAIGVSQPAIVTGIDDPVLNFDELNGSRQTYYNLQGQRISNPQPGQTVLLITPGQPARKIQYQ